MRATAWLIVALCALGALAEALGGSPTLTSISWQSAHPAEGKAASQFGLALASAFKRNQTIATLDLGENGLTDSAGNVVQHSRAETVAVEVEVPQGRGLLELPAEHGGECRACAVC